MIGLLILAVALAILYEVWAICTHKGQTITAIIQHAARNPLVPFLFGMLAGHLFW